MTEVLREPPGWEGEPPEAPGRAGRATDPRPDGPEPDPEPDRRPDRQGPDRLF